MQIENILQNELFSQIFNAISDGLVIADPNANLIWINNAALARTGLKRSEIIGKSLFDLEKKGVFRPSITRLVLEQKKIIKHLQYSLKSPTDTNPYVTIGYPLLHNSKIIGVLTHSRHLPEIVEATTRLEEAEALLQRYHIEIRRSRRYKMDDHTYFIGKNPKAIHAFHQAEQVAPLLPCLMLTGETGVGKTHLAHEIHALSPRHQEPFIYLNCNTLPESHLDTEIFGHYDPMLCLDMPSKSKAGLLELADKGTLFLDEIENLSLSSQVKLRHFLSTQKYLPIGANEEKNADVKIIVATHVNLKSMVESGKFRPDLYYKLNIFPIELPAVRKRKEDIPSLLKYFFSRFNQEYQHKCLLAPESLNLLQEYDWRGNIREIENFAERMVLTYPFQVIYPNDLPKEIRRHTLQQTILSPLKDEPLTEYLEKIEKNIIIKALHNHKTTRKTAEALKISQSLLMRRINKYKINFK